MKCLFNLSTVDRALGDVKKGLRSTTRILTGFAKCLFAARDTFSKGLRTLRLQPSRCDTLTIYYDRASGWGI